MGRQVQSLFSFNRGIISHLGLARVDIKRMQLSAQVQTNWMPRVLGSMMLRPGLKYIGAIANNLAARILPFVFSVTDNALIELTNFSMRIWINDALVTRANVSTSVVNGTFVGDLTGWTQSDEAGATSAWVAPNYLQLTGTGNAAAIRDQQVTVIAGDQNIQQALRIVVPRGPVTLRVGTMQGDDSYINETILETGTHSLALTPTGDYWIRFLSRNLRLVWVSNCTVERAGVMSIPTKWSADDLSAVRIDQSADVIFAACNGVQQQRIERRGTHSWSVVDYKTSSGPYRIQNITQITLAASEVAGGNITLTASSNLFYPTQVGSIYTLSSIGQTIQATLSAQNTFTSPVLIESVGSTRAITILISGTFVGTLQLQYSVASSVGPWTDVPGQLWTAPVTTSYNDALPNQIIYYRLGFEAGMYTSGAAVIAMYLAAGSITGVVRATGYTDAQHMQCEVLVPCGSTTPTTSWSEGSWSDFRGWPSSVALHQGRLWWSGKSSVWGSISDDYANFDPLTVGASGVINVTLGFGQVDTITWMLALQRLLLGGEGSELTVMSDVIETPLTSTNLQIRAPSTQGSSAVAAIKIDMHGVFIGRTGVRVFSMDMGTNYPFYDYVPNDMTALCPELGRPGIVRMDKQRCPDTRVHCVRSDGIVMMAVSDKNEDVLAWVQLQTDGIIEDVVVLPAITGNLDDQVYYVVNRTINGQQVRYLEKMAQETECRGDLPLCNLADSYVSYTGAPITVVTGLGNMEGRVVTVWADGQDVGTDDTVNPWVQIYTVHNGKITLPVAASNIVVGLPYAAQFQSAKLGQATQERSSPLNAQKRINHIGLVMADVHPKGVQYGPSFDVLDDMPGIEHGAPVGTAVHTDYDENTIEFPGIWTTDMRVCLQAQAPRPATVLGVTIECEMN